MKILLAVDDSDPTRRLLEYVTAHPLFGREHEYTVFNAQPRLSRRAAAALGTTATHAFHEEESAKVLGPVLAQLHARGLTATGAWKTGPAGETIARFAQEGGYELLVMGTHRWGALGRLLMGSVTTRVLALCTVPVLLVR